MTKISSTMLSVGTLLRRAEDTGATVRVLVQGTWLDGRVLGCDGLGAVLDDGNGHQSLVRLDSVVAVTFSRAVFSSTFVQSYPPTRGSETIAFMPAACTASRSFAYVNPATVSPHSPQR